MALASVTVSLDGYMARPQVSREQPMGLGGARLHQWIIDPTPTDQEIISETFDAVGAVVLGRRTFDVGLAHWDDDTPYPCPSFVVTHRPHGDIRTVSASTCPPSARSGTRAMTSASGSAHCCSGWRSCTAPRRSPWCWWPVPWPRASRRPDAAS